MTLIILRSSLNNVVVFYKETIMTEHTYKHIELTGSSAESSDQAIQNAIAKAAETIKNMHWFNVIDTRGYIEDDGVKYWQVTIKIGFRVD